MAETQKSTLERTANFFEKLNIFVGAIALTGALIAPPPLQETFMKLLELQAVEATGWIALKPHIQSH